MNDQSQNIIAIILQGTGITITIGNVCALLQPIIGVVGGLLVIVGSAILIKNRMLSNELKRLEIEQKKRELENK